MKVNNVISLDERRMRGVTFSLVFEHPEYLVRATMRAGNKMSVSVRSERDDFDPDRVDPKAVLKALQVVARGMAKSMRSMKVKEVRRG